MLFATPSTLALTHAAWVTAVAQRIPLPLRILISIPIPILAQHLHQSLQRLGSPLLRPSRALQHIHHVGSVLGGGGRNRLCSITKHTTFEHIHCITLVPVLGEMRGERASMPISCPGSHPL